MTRAASSPPRASEAAAKKSAPGKSKIKGYFDSSQLPLISLAFLTPFLLIYEFWAVNKNITAFTWLNKFFEMVGVTGRHLPALAVVCILMGWHISRRDKWMIEPKYLIGMLLESIALAYPLIMIGNVAMNYIPMAGISRPVSAYLPFVGAGIYEELVFRLIAFWLLNLVLVHVLSIKRTWANLLMVLISSLAFSLYHYLGVEHFQLTSFVIRTLAGLYFALIYTYRGFGVTAGCHTAYDVIVGMHRLTAS